MGEPKPQRHNIQMPISISLGQIVTPTGTSCQAKIILQQLLPSQAFLAPVRQTALGLTEQVNPGKMTSYGLPPKIGPFKMRELC
jgi:hypothetical protein